MSTFLRLPHDPTLWVVADTDADMLAARVRDAGGPIAVDVAAPLRGRLVIASDASVVALSAPAGDPGWVPGYFGPPGPSLYTPTLTGVTENETGYVLAAGVDLAEVERMALDAMDSGSLLDVPVAEGALLVQGASVAFVVICPVAADS